MVIKRWTKTGKILTIWLFCLTIEKVGVVSNTITTGQDAPPTGLVLYGSRYNPTVVLLYKVELSQALQKTEGNIVKSVEKAIVYS